MANEIEEYIMIGEEIDTTLRLYKKYLEYSTENDFLVPQRIIKTAERELRQNYTNKINEENNTNNNNQIKDLLSEIKKENNKRERYNIQCDDTHLKIKQILTRQTLDEHEKKKEKQKKRRKRKTRKRK